MTNNVDLFEEDVVDDGRGADAPVQAEMAIPPAGTFTRRQRPAAVPANGDGGRHYRLAMRAAHRLPRSDRRDQTRRLICHHLRCMLEDEAAAQAAQH